MAKIKEFPDQSPNAKGLTERQELILAFITSHTQENGYPPTVREIMHAAGLNSPSSVAYQLETLISKGYISKDGMKSRTIEVQSPDDKIAPARSVTVPLVGQIAAGSPILADQNIEEMFSLPETLVGKGQIFSLKVKGDSMIEAGIFDGDIAVIREQKTANNGEIVAAMIDGEATLKTLSIKNGRVYLIPQNSSYAPIPFENGTILGKLTAVMRSVK